MRTDFIRFIDAMCDAAPEVASQYMTDEIREYIELLKEGNGEATTSLTEKGSEILLAMQKSDRHIMSARQVGELMNVTTRAVSGTLRKLATDGYVERFGSNPIVYSLTEKGKNYKKIDKEND